MEGQTLECDISDVELLQGAVDVRVLQQGWGGKGGESYSQNEEGPSQGVRQTSHRSQRRHWGDGAGGPEMVGPEPKSSAKELADQGKNTGI